MLINLSNQTNFILNVHGRANASNGGNDAKSSTQTDNSFFNHLKKAFAWVGTKGSDVTFREEYHLTSKNDYLRSKTMLLNGNPLKLTDDGEIPRLDPALNSVHSPIYVAPLSIVFIVYPNFDAPACFRNSKL